ncbi:MAG: TetR family transcriptional regulator [Xanthomonadaceae bacterium]|nr:TetR family transcriptional regulator [Xanthomonadaceae bacterium]
MATLRESPQIRSKLINTATRLLAQQGPSAIQARAIAKEAGVSTMVVYSTFGGMPDLLRAVADAGYRALVAAFDEMPRTDDAVADIFRMALAYRAIARANPHLYDLMFGLSTRGQYRAIELEAAANRDAESAPYQLTYGYLVKAAARLVEAGRVRADDPEVIAAQLWSYVHGFISLELSGYFAHLGDCVHKVLLPLGINMVVGLGDTPAAATASVAAAAEALKPPANTTAAARRKTRAKPAA